MEEYMMNKRRRVYSPEPNKVMQAMFARKYVNHLVPALMNINKKSSSSSSSSSLDENYNNGTDDDSICGALEKLVRYEVDKALVMSTTPSAFAWSHALKHKLDQQKIHNVGRFDKNNEASGHDTVNPNGVKKPKRPTISSSLSSSSSPSSKLLQPRIRKEEDAKESGEEEEIGRQLANLRSILPGGNEIGVNELFSEVESYITCLELQVKVLSCLVDTPQ